MFHGGARRSRRRERRRKAGVERRFSRPSRDTLAYSWRETRRDEGVARGWESAHARENYPFSRADRRTRLLSRSPGSRDERALRAPLKATPDSEPRPSPAILASGPPALLHPLSSPSRAGRFRTLAGPFLSRSIAISRGILSRPYLAAYLISRFIPALEFFAPSETPSASSRCVTL